MPGAKPFLDSNVLIYFDSLMLASALENECDVLYSEDFQDGQIVEDRLRITNPFK